MKREDAGRSVSINRCINKKPLGPIEMSLLRSSHKFWNPVAINILLLRSIA